MISLDLRGFAVSSGAACSSGAVEPSHVLTAIGLSREDARSCIRFSLGASNTKEQVDAADRCRGGFRCRICASCLPWCRHMPDAPIAVAMWGGVDSSTVAAMLVRDGHNVIGLTMQLWNQRRLPELSGDVNWPLLFARRCV